MHDLTTPIILFSIVVGLFASVWIGRGTRAKSAGTALAMMLVALMIAFMVMMLAFLLQESCAMASLCAKTKDTNIYNFPFWPLLASPVNWLLMVGSGKPDDPPPGRP